MDFALIETLRWEPDSGFLRGRMHLDRLRASAAALGFAFDEDAARAALDDVATGADALRVRLELSPEGRLAATVAPYLPQPPETVWRLAVAATRLSSSDPLLRHKTTRREAYAAARAEFSVSEIDEVVLLNEKGLVCEGAITSLFVRREEGAPLLTPPLSSGLLAGVLRRELVESGAAREAELTPGDLAAAREIWCGNSLRGLIPAVLG